MHIGIILDGNRRYAKSLGLDAWKGHEFGAQKVKDLLTWARELKISELTLYCFSKENFKRSEKEVSALLSLFKEYFTSLLENLAEDARICFLGDKSLFPADLEKIMERIEEETKNNSPLRVNFCMGYTGREEILEACKKLAKRVEDGQLSSEDIREEEFEKHLQLSSQPDLIIRTSGEQRLSGFLLWQSAYSELLFIKKNWPELERADLEQAIEEYSTRQRRFGS